MDTGTVILAGYLIGVIGSFIPLTRVLLKWWTTDDEYETGDIAMAASLALCIAPMWPLVLPVIWAVALIKSDKRKSTKGGDV